MGAPARGRTGPPGQKRRRRPTGQDGTPQNFDSSSTADTTAAARLVQAFRLDRLADALLAIGRHAAAEWHSHRAAELRGAP
jgi:hypothetical protein